jgi:DHA2 family multidrug resistance protein-like MFS transporter
MQLEHALATSPIDTVSAAIVPGIGGALGACDDLATPGSRRKAGPREWIGLGVLALPCLVYAMDLTVLDLALPQISVELRPTSSQLLWIADIYGFMVAGCLITMGSLGDRIGRRRLLMIGAAGFGVASVVAALSTSVAMLIAARVLLGIAGASFAPSTLSLIRGMFLEPRQRTVAIGVWATSYSLGGAIGPLLGGLVLQQFAWGSVFLIGVPVMVVLVAVGPLLLPEFRDPDAGALDLPSAALSLASVLLVIYGVKRCAEDGLAWVPAGAIAAGVAVGTAFLRRQRTLARPMIDLRLFRERAFSTSLGAYALGIFLMFGGYLFVAQYLQLVLGLSPLHAGLATLPSMMSFIGVSLVVPLIARRVRPTRVMAWGLVLVAIGFAVLTQVGALGIAAVIVGSVIYSIGTSPLAILATDLVVGSAPVERAGAASAISETGAELGGALGIAILGSVSVAVYRSIMADGLPAQLPAEAAAVARSTLGGALEVADQLSGSRGTQLLDIARDAFTRGFAWTAAVSVLLALIMAAVMVVRLRPSRAAAVDN